VARPKSEDKKMALLDAAAVAIAKTGIAASTAVIARNAGVAEGTLFRYFATKDDLLNALYLHLKSDLCQTMIDSLDRSLSDPKYTPSPSGTAISTGASVIRLHITRFARLR
jgi:AcrR family transcriptional regulator